MSDIVIGNRFAITNNNKASYKLIGSILKIATQFSKCSPNLLYWMIGSRGMPVKIPGLVHAVVQSAVSRFNHQAHAPVNPVFGARAHLSR